MNERADAMDDRPNYRPVARLLPVLLCLFALVVGTGCRATRPMLLPIVGSAGEVAGQWDDLDIYLIDPIGGGDTVRLTDTPDLMETDPDINRDRTWVVYVQRSVTDGRHVLDYPDDAIVDPHPVGESSFPFPSKLIVSNTSGSEQRVLYSSDRLIFTPVWSHDGKRVAFTEVDGEGRLEVKLINADGSGLETLGYGSSPSWRIDDEAIFYSTLDRPDAEKGDLQLRELRTGLIHDLGLAGTGHTNLRAGVSVAFVPPAYSRRNETIWLFDANGHRRRLTDPNEHQHDLQPVFFGSEGNLVFTRYNSDNGMHQLMHVHRNTQDRVAEPVAQPATHCFTRGGLWVARYYPR